jgi:hypothetical protein
MSAWRSVLLATAGMLICTASSADEFTKQDAQRWEQQFQDVV